MFLHLCVILYGGGGLFTGGVCSQGGGFASKGGGLGLG